MTTNLSKSQMAKALKISMLGDQLDVYPIRCFPLSKRAPLKGVVDGVSRRVDARRFIQCKGVTDSFRMKQFDKENDEKYETKSVMLHFDSEYLPDRVFLDHVSYPVRQYVPKPLQCTNCWKFVRV